MSSGAVARCSYTQTLQTHKHCEHMNTVNRQTNKNTASLQTDDKTKHTDEKEANLQVKNVGCWYLTYIHASQMGTPCRQLLIYIGVYSLLFQWLVHDSFNINPLMFHNLFVLLHRVRLKPPPCCSMAFRDATTTFLSLVTCQQPKREKPPCLLFCQNNTLLPLHLTIVSSQFKMHV